MGRNRLARAEIFEVLKSGDQRVRVHVRNGRAYHFPEQFGCCFGAEIDEKLGGGYRLLKCKG